MMMPAYLGTKVDAKIVSCIGSCVISQGNTIVGKPQRPELAGKRCAPDGDMVAESLVERTCARVDDNVFQLQSRKLCSQVSDFVKIFPSDCQGAVVVKSEFAELFHSIRAWQSRSAA